MNLTSNERLLQVLAQALESTLLPELQSPNARAIGGIMQAVLADLLKRETRTQEVLERCIAEGRALGEAMAALLRRAGRTPAVPDATASIPITPLAIAIEQHAALARWLGALAAQLAASRTEPALADAQADISALLRRGAVWEQGFFRELQTPLPALAVKPAPRPLTPEILSAFLRDQHPEGAAISVADFAPIPGGFGKQTSRFKLRDAAGKDQELIARKNDPCPMLLSGGFVIAREFHLVKALNATGYPAPKPLWLGQGVTGVDADFYIMERLPGTVPGSFLGGLDGSDSEVLLLDVATQLGRLHAHSIDVFADYIRAHDDPALLTDTVESCCRRHLAQWRQYAAERPQLGSPFLHYLFDWLEQNLPADTRRPLLIHGDFNIHNLLVQDGRVSGVLDWECAMFGAPEHELAYIQPHISQHIDWSRFVAQYLASGGRVLDRASLSYWLAFSSLRMQIAMRSATHNLRSGINDDFRYAMVELGFGPRFIELGMMATAAH